MAVCCFVVARRERKPGRVGLLFKTNWRAGEDLRRTALFVTHAAKDAQQSNSDRRRR